MCVSVCVCLYNADSGSPLQKTNHADLIISGNKCCLQSG